MAWTTRGKVLALAAPWSVLLGHVACGAEEPALACEEIPICLEDTDGCNDCCYHDPGGWWCTEVACSESYSPAGGCYSFPCVADVDASPGLQYDCWVDAGVEDDGGPPVRMPPCELQGGEEPSMPAGETACYVVRTGDELSFECLAHGYVLAFEFLFADEPPPGWRATPGCEHTDFWEWIDGEAACFGPGPAVFPPARMRLPATSSDRPKRSPTLARRYLDAGGGDDLDVEALLVVGWRGAGVGLLGGGGRLRGGR